MDYRHKPLRWGVPFGRRLGVPFARRLTSSVRSTGQVRHIGVQIKSTRGGSRVLLARLRELEAREDELRARLAQTPRDIPDIHPNVAGIYRRKVESLAEALQRPQERLGEWAEANPGALIDHITLTAGPRRARDRRHAARRPRHDPRMDGPKCEHSRPGWRGGVGFRRGLD